MSDTDTLHEVVEIRISNFGIPPTGVSFLFRTKQPKRSGSRAISPSTQYHWAHRHVATESAWIEIAVDRETNRTVAPVPLEEWWGSPATGYGVLPLPRRGLTSWELQRTCAKIFIRGLWKCGLQTTAPLILLKTNQSISLLASLMERRHGLPSSTPARSTQFPSRLERHSDMHVMGASTASSGAVCSRMWGMPRRQLASHKMTCLLAGASLILCSRGRSGEPANCCSGRWWPPL